MTAVDRLVSFMRVHGLDEGVEIVLASPLFPTDDQRRAALYGYCRARGLTTADGLNPEWLPDTA